MPLLIQERSELTPNDGLINVKFLPTNVTVVIQSVDQGLISSMKRCDWADLLRALSDEDDSIIALWEK
jgi:hypothetical protein